MREFYCKQRYTCHIDAKQSLMQSLKIFLFFDKKFLYFQLTFEKSCAILNSEEIPRKVSHQFYGEIKNRNGTFQY